MAAREAVSIIADALEDNLQTKLDALDTCEGEQVPQIARYANVFEHDEELVGDWPAVVLDVGEVSTPSAEFEQVVKADVFVPIVIAYLDDGADTAIKRGRASYVARAILQVLNDITGTSLNSVQFIQFRDLSYTWTTDDSASNPGLVVVFNAHMRELSP